MAKNKLDTGRMRHRIIIEDFTPTGDGIGGSSRVWVTFATVWADIKPINAEQLLFSDKIDKRITHIILIRPLAGILPRMRISFQSRIFHIHEIREYDEKNRITEITAKEGAAS
jgi:SPP1 family predicted phage head-tail adaptor